MACSRVICAALPSTATASFDVAASFDGIETDTQAEIASPEIKAGTSVITTRPDNLQDKSPVLAMGAR